MKKLFIALVAILSAAVSQKAEAQLLDFDGMPPYKLGATVGFNVPSFTADGFDYTIGFQVGADLMMDASELFSNTFVRTGLKYSMKGATWSGTNLNPKTNLPVEDKVYYTSHYLEIPIHYGYAWAIDRDWSVMAETGPYFALGLGGTARHDDDNIFESNSFFGDCNASRFDYGWGIQASVLYDQQWQLSLGYDWGFRNMNQAFLQNRMLNLGITFYFEY